jgi:hypothetical protein
MGVQADHTVYPPVGIAHTTLDAGTTSASNQTTLSREASTAQPICLFPAAAELGLIDK